MQPGYPGQDPKEQPPYGQPAQPPPYGQPDPYAQQPPQAPIYPPAGYPAPPSKDRTTLWGVLGIVTGLLCCFILGVVFGTLSLQEAKKHGKTPTLAYIAFGLAGLNLIITVIYYATL